jgi:hypothetical protein
MLRRATLAMSIARDTVAIGTRQAVCERLSVPAPASYCRRNGIRGVSSAGGDQPMSEETREEEWRWLSRTSWLAHVDVMPLVRVYQTHGAGWQPAGGMGECEDVLIT